MEEELSAELLDRAGRDQAVRMSVRPGHGMAEWETVVAPVDWDNIAWLRGIIGRHGWPGHRLVGEAGHACGLAAGPARAAGAAGAVAASAPGRGGTG